MGFHFRTVSILVIPIADIWSGAYARTGRSYVMTNLIFRVCRAGKTRTVCGAGIRDTKNTVCIITNHGGEGKCPCLDGVSPHTRDLSHELGGTTYVIIKL